MLMYIKIIRYYHIYIYIFVTSYIHIIKEKLSVDETWNVNWYECRKT